MILYLFLSEHGYVTCGLSEVVKLPFSDFSLLAMLVKAAERRCRKGLGRIIDLLNFCFTIYTVEGMLERTLPSRNVPGINSSRTSPSSNQQS